MRGCFFIYFDCGHRLKKCSTSGGQSAAQGTMDKGKLSEQGKDGKLYGPWMMPAVHRRWPSKKT